MKRPLVALVALLVSVVPFEGSSAGATVPWTGQPGLVAGAARYDAGEWIYTDFVYDDYGADTTPGGQPNVVSLAGTAGDFRYPDGPAFADNAADIVFVRARLGSGGDLEVQVELQTITDPAVVALSVAANLGTPRIVTAADALIDLAANTVTFTIPDVASSNTVDLVIGAGLHDGNGGLRTGVTGTAHAYPFEFTTGGPTDARLFDLAFNSHAIEGRGGAWNEEAQSDALAAGDISAFSQTIDVTALRDGVTTPADAPAGYSVHLFRSGQDLGEGVAASFPQYRGRWQPYAVWIPQDYTPGEAVPFLLNMHSLSVHHNQYRGFTASSSYRTKYEQIEQGLGAIVATPLARGPDGWYEDEALVDTLEVWADVLDRYTIDPERVHVGGYSMGGYGSYRLATMMPDAIASAYSVVGPPSNGIWAYPLTPTGGANNPDNTYPQLESTLHVPFWITHGVQDELVPFTGVAHQAERFAELEHEYRFALHPVADHFAFAYTDEWSREIGWLADHPTRATDPRRITLDVRPASWATGGNPVILAQLDALTERVGARLDGAYWISDVQVAPGTDVTGEIDIQSGWLLDHQIGVTDRTGPGLDGPSPHVLTGSDKRWGSAGPPMNRIRGTLTGVTALTIDVGRANLTDTPIWSVQHDLPVTVTYVRDGAVVGSSSYS